MSETGTTATTPEHMPRPFVERLQAESAAPESVKVTSEMLNAMAPRAVEIMKNDLLDYTSMHHGTPSIYATIGSQTDAILRATENVVHHIVRDMNKPLPESCKDLTDRLRDPANLDLVHPALREANCREFYADAVKENFGKMLRKLAKENRPKLPARVECLDPHERSQRAQALAVEFGQGPQQGLRCGVTIWEPFDAVPDFIDVPASLRSKSLHRPMEFTDIPRDIMQQGKINLNKMPVRGTDTHARCIAMWDWLDDEKNNGEWPGIAEHHEALRHAVNFAGPNPARMRSMGHYMDWLTHESAEKFLSRLQEIDGLAPDDMARLDAAYRAMIPTVAARVEKLAADFVADEFMKPHINNFER